MSISSGKRGVYREGSYLLAIWMVQEKEFFEALDLTQNLQAQCLSPRFLDFEISFLESECLIELTREDEAVLNLKRLFNEISKTAPSDRSIYLRLKCIKRII